jgi:HEAT repeat protein
MCRTATAGSHRTQREVRLLIACKTTPARDPAGPGARRHLRHDCTEQELVVAAGGRVRRRVTIIAPILAGIAIGIAVWKLPASLKPVVWLVHDLDAADDSRSYSARQELARRREPRAIPVLIRQLDTDDSMAAGYVARALAAIGEAAIDPLISALGAASPHMRAHAAYALGEIADPRAVEALENALGDSDKHVRRSAASALAGVRSPRAVDIVVRLIAGGDRDLAYGAALWLGRDHGHPAASPGIIQMFDEMPDAARRGELVKALGKIGTVDAISFIAERLLTEPSPYVRMEMASVVARSDDPAVAAALDDSAAAGRLEVIAGAHAYYLRARPDLDEHLLIEAFRRYGGESMTNAFRNSGRTALVQAAADEAAQAGRRPKSIEVK